MLDMKQMHHHNVMASGLAVSAVCRVTSLWFRQSGTRVELAGLEHLPKEPSLIATNASYKYDFWPLRWALDRHGIDLVTVSKGKNFHHPMTAALMGLLGTVPITSRGYILAVDFMRVHGRRPGEDEYRALRQHIDGQVPLPPAAVYQVLETLGREMLGYPFDPLRERYRDAVFQVYHNMMCETLRLAGEVVNAGRHLHIYPEGTVSSRLATGRIGAVQLALALGLPMVPVGISGCREVFRPGRLSPHGGVIRIRMGPPFRVAPDTVPQSFHFFHPEDEASERGRLQAETDQLMGRINDLLDPAYRWADDRRSDGVQGTHRFV